MPALVTPNGKHQATLLPPDLNADYPTIQVEQVVASTYLLEWDRTNLAPEIGYADKAM